MANAHIDSSEQVPPAAPPRELTATIRRRAWNERHVRVWWLLGAAMFGIACYYAIERVYAWTDEKRLITQGEKVFAEVVAGGGNAAPKGMKRPLPADTIVDMEFKYKDQTYQVRGELAGRTEPIMTRTPIQLIIDPANPMHWTARTVPSSLVHEMVPGLALLPFAVILFALALLKRSRVLKIYRQGEGIQAEVVSVGHSATAPLSRMIGCVVPVGSDARLIKILLPTRKTPAVGESLWLLAFPERPEQAIPVALFE